MPAERSNPQTTSASGSPDTTVNTTPSPGSMNGGYSTFSGPACRAWLFECVETAAEERHDRVDQRCDLVGAVWFRVAASLGHHVERGDQGGGDDLRAEVVLGCTE